MCQDKFKDLYPMAVELMTITWKNFARCFAMKIEGTNSA